MDFEKEIPLFLHPTSYNNSDLRTKVVVQELVLGSTRFSLRGKITLKAYNHMDNLAELTYSIEPNNFLSNAYKDLHNDYLHKIIFTTPNLAHIPAKKVESYLNETKLNASSRFIDSMKSLLIEISEKIVEEKKEIEICSNNIDNIMESEKYKKNYENGIFDILNENSEIMVHKINIEKFEKHEIELREALKALESNFIIVKSEKELEN